MAQPSKPHKKVFVADAKACVERVQGMRPAVPLLLPDEVDCMNIWEVLQGEVTQQRVWTFGRNSAPADSSAKPSVPGRGTSAGPADGARQAVCGREPLSVMNGVRFISCSAGHRHSAAAAEGGFVYTWGVNDHGQLGCSTSRSNSSNAADSPSTGGIGRQLVDTEDTASCSGGSMQPVAVHTVALQEAVASERTCAHMDSMQRLAASVKLPPDMLLSMAQAHASGSTSAADANNIQPSSSTAASGSGSGTAGQQQRSEQQLHVYRLHVAQAVAMVACGAAHTLVALQGNGLVAWGDNSKGQLGVLPGLSQKTVPLPMRVGAFDNVRLCCVSAGSKHSAAVLENGAVCCWGHGRYGRLGVGGEPDMLPPMEVAALKSCAALQVACGTAHTLALTEDGRLYAWGYNGNGALGMHDKDNRLSPAQVHGLLPCVSIAASSVSMAVACSGEVYVWGGSVMLGSKPLAEGEVHTPLSWLHPHHAVAAACGIENAAAVTSDGRLFMWGSRTSMPPSLTLQSQPLAPAQQLARSHSAAANRTASRQLSMSSASESEDADDVDDDSFWQLLEEQERRQQQEEREVFDPDGEQVQQLGCGEAHYALLCEPSVYLPTVGQVRGAVLAVLQAYLNSCGPEAPAAADAAATAACTADVAPPANAAPGAATGAVAASSAAAIEGPDPYVSLLAAQPVSEVGLHSIMLLCRELGLVDNLTEHQDVVRAFGAVLHKKRSRLGPQRTRKQQQQQQQAQQAEGMQVPDEAAAQPAMATGAGAGAAGGEGAGAGAGEGAGAATRQRRSGTHSAARATAAASGAAAVGSPPLHLVPVLRPGVQTAATATGPAAATAGATAAAARSAPASAAVQALTLTETLDMLLLLVSERHPQLHGSRELLLRTLAGSYCSRLKGRRADRGPSWLLRQLLQPEMLQGFDSSENSEVLHQVYAFLTGPNANTQDLHMTLGDVRSGLRHESMKAMAALAAAPLSAKPGSTLNRATAAAAAAPATAPARQGPSYRRTSSSLGSEPPACRFTVPLGRLAAFLRSAQLVPPLLVLLISQLTRQGEAAQKYGRVAALPIMPLLRVCAAGQQSAASAAPKLPPPLLEGSAPGTPASAAASSAQQAATPADALSSASSSASLASSRARSMRRQSSSSLGPPSPLASPAARAGPGPFSAHGLGGSSGPSSPAARRGSAFGNASALGNAPAFGSLSGQGGASLSGLGEGQQARRSLGMSSSFDGGSSRRWSKDSGGGRALGRRLARRSVKQEELLLTAGDDGQFDCSLLDDVELLPVRSRRPAILLESDPRRRQSMAASRASMRTSAADATTPLPSMPGLAPQPSTTNLAGAAGAASGAGAVSGAGAAATSDGSSVAASVLATPRDAAATSMSGVQQRLVTQKQQQLLATLHETPAALTAATTAAAVSADGSKDGHDAEAARQDAWLVHVLAALLGSCLISSHPEGGSSHAPGAIVDLRNHPISLPQFVEVLMLCFALRAKGIVNPNGATASNAKGPLPTTVQPLHWDAEMQENAKKVLTQIHTWRDKMVAPWRAGDGGGIGARRESLSDEVRQRLVLRCYALHGALLEPQACCFGLAAPQFLEFTKEAGIVDADLPAQVAKDLFDELVPKVPRQALPSRSSSPRLGPRATSEGGQQQLPAPPGATAAAGASAGIAAAAGEGAGVAAAAGASTAAAAASAGNVRAGQVAVSLGRPSTFARRVAARALGALKGTAAADDQPGQQQHHLAKEGQQLRMPAKLQQARQQHGAGGEQPPIVQEDSTSNPAPRLQQPVDRSSSAALPPTPPLQAPLQPHPPAAAPLVPHQRAMTRQQFLQALRRLSVAKFPAVSHGGTVWRLLMAQHLLPHMERKKGVFDEYLANLSTPSVRALLEARGVQVAELFTDAVAEEAAAAAAAAAAAGAADGAAGVGPEGQQPKLSFRGVLALLQQREAIPQLLQTWHVEEAAKRIGFDTVPTDELATGLTFDEFVQLLCMVGQAAFDAKRLHTSSMAPEEKLATFLDLLCLHGAAAATSDPLNALPGLGLAALGSDFMTTTSMVGGQQQLHAATQDPYEEWWCLQFGEGAGAGEGAPLVMLQELVLIPHNRPPAVEPLLLQAARLHSERSCDRALEALELAQVEWQDCSPGGCLTPEASIYFAAAASSILLTAGQDEEALLALEAAQAALEAAPEGAADAALWHSCTGIVLHALRDTDAAFEHCVHAMVMRQECRGLGPSHPDTALAAHNLACVLEALGKGQRAQQLLVQAAQTLQRTLGHDHPRSLVAARNLERLRLNAARPHQSSSPRHSQQAAAHSAGGRTLADRLWSLQARRGAPAANGQQPAAGSQVQRRGVRVGSAGRVRRRRKGLHQKDFIDPTYLGGGLHQATPEVRRMYQALLPDIAAHSRAASGSEGSDSRDWGGAASMAAARTAGSSGSSSSAGLLEMQVGESAVGTAPGQFPRPRPRQLQRGALGDATVVAVKKTADKLDALKQRRLEIAAKKRAAMIRKPTGLLDRLFGVAAQAPPKGPRERKREC